METAEADMIKRQVVIRSRGGNGKTMSEVIDELRGYKAIISGASVVLADAVFEFVKHILKFEALNRVFSGLEGEGLTRISLSNPDFLGFRSHIIIIDLHDSYKNKTTAYEVELGMARTHNDIFSSESVYHIDSRVVAIWEVDSITGLKKEIPL